MTDDNPRAWRGLIAGAVAGLAASAIMNAAQAAWLATQAKDDGGGEPATVKVANDLSERITGAPVPRRHRPLAGDVVHYATGAALGGLYGLASEYSALPTAGFGSAYGIAVAAVLDEAIVPALGLGDPPAKVPLETHIFGFASHVVFGISLEATRLMLGGRR